MTTKKTRAEDIEKAMNLVWSSLNSHLPWTYKNSSEGKIFHRRCVSEYVELLRLLNKLY